MRLEDVLLRPQQRHAQDGVAQAVEVGKVAAVLVPVGMELYLGKLNYHNPGANSIG